MVDRTGAGRAALVTGGARGIGHAIAAGLVAHGYETVVTSRDAAAAERAAEALNAAGDARARAHAIACDPGVEADLDALVVQAEAATGKIDVLVNNAGTYLEAPHRADGPPRSALEQPSAALRQSFEINTLAPYRLMQMVAPGQVAQGWGRIVNVASGSGQLADMGGLDPGYRLSKAALVAATRVFAAELDGRGVLVNAMCPGWVRSDVGGPDAPRTPEEGADTAVWLATLPDDGPTGGFFRNRQAIPF